MIRLVMFTCVAILAAGEDNEVISVPEDVLKFIIGCRQAQPGGQYAVPVHQTDINEAGTTSQHISLLSLEELRDSLRTTVNNKAVLGHIISQVEDAVKTDQLPTSGRSECAHVENHITIDVPPQEVDDFNDRVQMLMQQNTFLLLEQINTLFSYKLRAQNADFEKLIKRRTNQINKKLDKIMVNLGIELEDDDDVEGGNLPGTTELPVEIDWGDNMVTDNPQIWPITISEPESEPITKPDPEPVSEPEPISEPEPEPVTEQEPEPVTEPAAPAPKPTSSPIVVEPVTGVGMTDAPSATELFPDLGSNNTSSEEINDEAGVPSNIRISGSNPNQNTDFIRTSQQQPIVFNSGIGLIRPLLRRPNPSRPKPSRPSPNRPNPRPVYKGITLAERMAAQQRRFRPQGT